MRHATIFTLRREPQVIYIKDAGRNVVHNNCIRCHEQVFEVPSGSGKLTQWKSEQTVRDCLFCHRETPHGRVNSFSPVPHARIPFPASPVPSWMKKLLNQ
jgi:cytochrome c nitrite reductase small subunit